MELHAKQCTKCGAVKPPECFSPDRRRSDWLQGQCKECRSRDEAQRRADVPPEIRRARNHVEYSTKRQRKAAYGAEWKRRNRTRVRGYELKRRYGITTERLCEMMAEQDHKCAICRKPFPGKRRPHTDHDHKTGAVRGLLCGGCNIALGFIEKPGFLKAAQAYLMAAKAVGPADRKSA